MIMVPIPGHRARLYRRLIRAVFIASVVALVFTTSALAMVGQMVGQANVNGSVSGQTVAVSGWVMFDPAESATVVCVTLTQKNHHAYGCSKPVANTPGVVGWSATLYGSGLKAGSATAVATAYYVEDGKLESWSWPNSLTLG